MSQATRESINSIMTWVLKGTLIVTCSICGHVFLEIKDDVKQLTHDVSVMKERIMRVETLVIPPKQ